MVPTLYFGSGAYSTSLVVLSTPLSILLSTPYQSLLTFVLGSGRSCDAASGKGGGAGHSDASLLSTGSEEGGCGWGTFCPVAGLQHQSSLRGTIPFPSINQHFPTQSMLIVGI